MKRHGFWEKSEIIITSLFQGGTSTSKFTGYIGTQALYVSTATLLTVAGFAQPSAAHSSIPTNKFGIAVIFGFFLGLRQVINHSEHMSGPNFKWPNVTWLY